MVATGSSAVRSQMPAADVCRCRPERLLPSRFRRSNGADRLFEMRIVRDLTRGQVDVTVAFSGRLVEVGSGPGSALPAETYPQGLKIRSWTLVA